jgi:hypothetical protein
VSTFSLVLFIVAAGFYGWLSGIEIGIGMLRLLHKTTLTRYGIGLFRPLWLVTTLFLAISIASFASFFRKDLSFFSGAIRTTLFVGIALLVIRAIAVIYIFYGKKHRSGFSAQNIVFLILSFGVPLTIGAVGVSMLSGASFWSNGTGWLLMCALFLGLLALAGAFVYFIVGLTPQGRTRTISRLLNTAFCVFVAVFVQRSLALHYAHILTLPFIIFTVLIGLIIIWQVILHLSGQERYMWFYLSLVALSAPLLLALANRPYLIYPNALVSATYSPTNIAVQVSYSIALLACIVATIYLLVARPSSAASSSRG